MRIIELEYDELKYSVKYTYSPGMRGTYNTPDDPPEVYIHSVEPAQEPCEDYAHQWPDDQFLTEKIILIETR